MEHGSGAAIHQRGRHQAQGWLRSLAQTHNEIIIDGKNGGGVCFLSEFTKPATVCFVAKPSTEFPLCHQTLTAVLESCWVIKSN